MAKRMQAEAKGRSSKKSTTGGQMPEEMKAEVEEEQQSQEQSDGANVEQEPHNDDEVTKLREKLKANEIEFAKNQKRIDNIEGIIEEMDAIIAAWNDDTLRTDLLSQSSDIHIQHFVKPLPSPEEQFKKMLAYWDKQRSRVERLERKEERLIEENKELELKIKSSDDVSYIAPRMVSIAFQIASTPLSHTHDLDCFSNRIQELFEWWNENDVDKKWVGPYICFVQSSGMGKTKLMYEYRKQQDSATVPRSTQQKVAVALILPVFRDPPDDHVKQEVTALFDFILHLDKIVAAIKEIKPRPPLTECALKIHDKLDEMLAKIMEKHPNCKRIVLLFDESHHLLEENLGCAAFLFRCVRVWLREVRKNDIHNILVVAVFSGTNSRLSNFIVTGDWTLEGAKSASRDHQRKNKHDDRRLECIPRYPEYYR